MPSYLVKNNQTVWDAGTPLELADTLHHALIPALPTTQDFIAAWPERAAMRPWQTIRPIPGAAVGADDVENWLTDAMAVGWIRKIPNFDDTIKVILATFTVFTGLTLTRFLTVVPTATPSASPAPLDIGDLGNWRWWGFFALVALLLRYIIGSAIHLNHTYGGKEPRSFSVYFLFKDLMFLVFFGMLALYIMEASKPEDFARRAMLFVLAGFTWSIVDYLGRRFWCYAKSINGADTGTLRIIDTIFILASVILAIVVFERFGWTDIDNFLMFAAVLVVLAIAFCIINHLCTPKDMPKREWPGPFWRKWACLDGTQFLLIGIFVYCVPATSHGGLALIGPLAVLCIGFLLADMVVMIRALQSDLK